MAYTLSLALLSALPIASGFVLEERAYCPSYTLLNTRGSLEPQGESRGFKLMNSVVLDNIPGGKLYNTVYPAAYDQNSTSGTLDIINHIQQTLVSNPSECFILEGYSQGAAATVDAMPYISGPAFTAVKGVFLIGNPLHKPNLKCNVDITGGNSTYNSTGFEATSTRGIPSQWVAKTLDVCNYGDIFCDTYPGGHGSGTVAEHLVYPTDIGTQSLGAQYVALRLQT